MQALRAVFRREHAAINRRRERAMLDELDAQPARLRPEFHNLTPADLLNHYRERLSPVFFPGFRDQKGAARLGGLYSLEGLRLMEWSNRIVRDHRWTLMGFGFREFGNPINWHRDPLSGRVWPLDYHADIQLWHNDGSDIRALWELNRLGHLVTLGRNFALSTVERFFVHGQPYAITNEGFDEECFDQVASWRSQNPVGRGANWACAMEVALRAINLLVTFSLLRNSPGLNEDRLLMWLQLLEQHGSHIRRNLELSAIANSNHYLANVAGLLWLGVMLPELEVAAEWRAWALSELQREVEKQILPDGVDYEGSTGYHAFVLELALYSFILCEANGIAVSAKYRQKLHAMLRYLRAILRPDGLMPLIGDTDGGQVLSIYPREANDRSHLLFIGALVLKDPELMPAEAKLCPEADCLLETEVVNEWERQRVRDLIEAAKPRVSESSPGSAKSNHRQSLWAFRDAGTYAMRHEDLFLLFNTNEAKKGRPTSHRQNDLLSVEVSAGGCAFIVDPGTYVYTADLNQRHLFRSTAYHSTIQIDDVEQNSIEEDAPFVIGNEARVKVLSCESTLAQDRIIAEHSGYARLAQPAIHRRTITFDKQDRWWLIEDEILGRGEHLLAARFHFAPGIAVELFDNNSVVARGPSSGTSLILRSLDLDQAAAFEAQFTSRNYGSKDESITTRWTKTSRLPCKLRWAIVPVCEGESLQERMNLTSDI